MGLGLRGRGRRSVEHAVGFPGQNKLEGNLVYNWLARVRTAGTNEWWTVYSDIGPTATLVVCFGFRTQIEVLLWGS